MIPILIITLLIISLIFNQLISYVNGAMSELSQDTFLQLTQNNTNTKLRKIWDKYDEICNTLLCWQICSGLIFVALLTSIGIIFHYEKIIPQSASILPMIVFLVSIKILLIAFVISSFFIYNLGKRFCKKTLISLVTFINIITIPISQFINKIIRLFDKISGMDDDVDIDDITDLVEEAHEDGTIDAGEYRILTNVMKINEILVSDVMTPRTVLFSCHADMTVAETTKLPELQIFSRFPVWKGNSIDDEIVGYVTTKEIFSAALNNKSDIPLTQLARKIHFIPENAELGKTLEEFLLNKQQLYLVVDEYGGIEGLITMEDILEAMLGVEIIDEADRVVDLRVLAKSKRELRTKEQQNRFVVND